MCVLNNLVLIVLAIILKNKNFKSQFSILGFGGNVSAPRKKLFLFMDTFDWVFVRLHIRIRFLCIAN